MANLIDTDCFKFNEQKIFAALRQVIAPLQASETQNLIECKDDMLFVWNSVDCNVMCFNWRAANARHDESIKYQVSFGNESIPFDGICRLNLTSLCCQSAPVSSIFIERWYFSFQTLLPSSPQNYVVDKITASQEGSYLALSGSRGVAILELPRRYGPNGTFSEGRDKIICRFVNKLITAFGAEYFILDNF